MSQIKNQQYKHNQNILINNTQIVAYPLPTNIPFLDKTILK